MTKPFQKNPNNAKNSTIIQSDNNNQPNAAFRDNNILLTSFLSTPALALSVS